VNVRKSVFMPAARLVSTIALAACGAATAVASPVRITHGNESGQGQVFALGADSCYAFTAGHVLRAVPVVMVDADGYRAEGAVLAVDDKLDVGLVQVRGAATRNAKFCNLVSTPMMRVEAALEQMRGKPLGAWLDRISSPAGGLDRFELALRRGSSAGVRKDHLVEMVPGDSTHEARRDRRPQKGDSGATVWISDRPAAMRYSKDGAPVPRAVGRILGISSSVEGDVARVVRSDRLHEFIFNTLQPVDWRGVRVEPASAVVVAHQRSTFREPNYVDLPLHPMMLDHIAFELDLGNQDTLVEAVSISLAAASSSKVRPRHGQHQIVVSSSQFRPQDGAKWVREICAPTPGQLRRPGDRPPAGVTCTLKAARVARGLRVEIVGDPTVVRGVEVRAGR
jgi:hypothetical protein